LRVVTPTVDGDVLRVLALSEGDFTAPSVQRMIGEHSVDGVRRSLNRLCEQGIVVRRGAGNASLYSLNRRHLAALSIIELARLKATFLERVRDQFASWDDRCTYAALFGSVARGEMRVDSDIDIVVVKPFDLDGSSEGWDAQLDELRRRLEEWTGNRAHVLVLNEDAIEEALRSGDSVLRAIIDEGLWLDGPPQYLRDCYAAVLD
jgi:predicted nucleotidyltransferase